MKIKYLVLINAAPTDIIKINTYGQDIPSCMFTNYTQ